MSNVRAQAAHTLYHVVDRGVSLSAALPRYSRDLNPKDKALMQQICYGVLRYLPSLEFYCQQLLDEPLKGKRRVYQFLLYVGLYQLIHMRVPEHAAVGETVNALKAMRAPGLKGLVNAVLRSFQRQRDELEAAATQIDACKYNHPGWLLKKLKRDYPEHWHTIVAQNQAQAPMWLRVNQRQYTCEQYAHLLSKQGIEYSQFADYQDAIKLKKAVDVQKLPEFFAGASSVQDAAAQQAARLLGAQDGEYVLDACAAPGGKTCHILELADAKVMALDCDAERLDKVRANLQRLQLDAELVCAQAQDTESWWQGQQFDRILLDVPCSATGVIRRHPDIKWLRRHSDIDELAKLQGQILDAIWPLLKPGGTLLYATCSVLSEENQEQMKAFFTRHRDAQHSPLHEQDSIAQPGWQLLPGDTDGFYYAKIIKQ
ncbi:16S rRNA (cytosine(967)-C(5))-methyltransferase RsmB [Pseudoalteromonas sp. Cnat2-41]|uniref:16S rRNA (cytosine(967)-C(5))-methyltransferase RsmB n=1 Tax=Pseudoalteromonas TaxID=53246 RepID=UPI001243D5AE|nr:MULTISPECIES: 16S rRNA (cytosine(967)-C(5))-methyltransferase RsmB [Pseudoalteromonas]MCF2863809.1 16S rRNA (cytosine(967)-C(5))-methyltransferase RsmB [Pseudoalteromonas sp. CNAT2-18]MCG7559441.1 16S rRNA (cytosine(967)-C(5))-methyltransferase RsmB [Pseudoalteromonas sp. CNAT2-18.1]